MPTPYNMAFACLGCRKSFKREFDLADGCPGQLCALSAVGRPTILAVTSRRRERMT